MKIKGLSDKHMQKDSNTWQIMETVSFLLCLSLISLSPPLSYPLPHSCQRENGCRSTKEP